MSDSLLVEALDDTRALLDDLDDDDDDDASAPCAYVRALRARVDILVRASEAIELRPTPREQVVQLARLAIEVRDDAVALRRRHRSVQQLIQKMMD